MQNDEDAKLKARRDEGYLAAIKRLPFLYESRPGVVMPWDNRLRALIEHVRPGAWDRDRFNSVNLITITEHFHGFAAAAHLVGCSSFFTAYEEVVAESSGAEAMRLAIKEHPFLKGTKLERFEAPDIDAAWEGLAELYVGPHPARAPAPVEDDFDNFDRFARSTAVGGTTSRHQIIGYMIAGLSVVS